MEKTLVAVLAVLLGLCVGSFCNVLIFRLPRGEEFVETPSHCMSCGHRLSWYENIPLLSFLIQKGKCRSCGVKLSALDYGYFNTYYLGARRVIGG